MRNYRAARRRREVKPYKTIEFASRRATYRHRDGYTVYQIDEYPSSSVLAGQQRRSFLDTYPTLAEAKAAYPDVQLIEGTTYRSPDLSHLSDDGGY